MGFLLNRFRIIIIRDSKNVVIVTSVEIWLLTGDGKPRYRIMNASLSLPPFFTYRFIINRPEADVSSIFKFRCIEEQGKSITFFPMSSWTIVILIFYTTKKDDLFILVEKSGIPIVYGTRPPDRNKDPAALYVVRFVITKRNQTIA